MKKKKLNHHVHYQFHQKKLIINQLTVKLNSQTDPSYQVTNDSYFDSLFDGDYFRKTSTNDYQSLNSSYQQPISTQIN